MQELIGTGWTGKNSAASVSGLTAPFLSSLLHKVFKSLEMQEGIRNWTMRFKTKPASVVLALTIGRNVDRMLQQLIRPASTLPQVSKAGNEKQPTPATLFVPNE
ncbi:hypothetical protein HispidOSU_020889 [Sigmodon hispidus]